MPESSGAIGVFLIGVALLTGCSGYAAPRVTLAEARVSEVSAEAAALELALHLENSNDAPLELGMFSYHVEVDGKRVYSGTWSAQATLAGNAERRLTIPAVIVFAELGWAPAAPPPAVAFELRGSVQYLTPGEIAEVLFEAGVRRPKAHFDGRGDVTLTTAPALGHRHENVAALSIQNPKSKIQN